jgi:hypothetical protein
MEKRGCPDDLISWPCSADSVRIGFQGLDDAVAYPVDKVANAVYAWEKVYVESSPALYLSNEQVISLVTRASWREKIPVPQIRFINSQNHPCQAHIDTWMLDIVNWGRTPCTVLHEVAHLATMEAILNGEDPHGPTFVSKCIDLYHHFIGIPMEKLLWSADRAGVRYGTIAIRPKASAKLENSFDSIEF